MSFHVGREMPLLRQAVWGGLGFQGVVSGVGTIRDGCKVVVGLRCAEGEVYISVREPIQALFCKPPRVLPQCSLLTLQVYGVVIGSFSVKALAA